MKLGYAFPFNIPLCNLILDTVKGEIGDNFKSSTATYSYSSRLSYLENKFVSIIMGFGV